MQWIGAILIGYCIGCLHGSQLVGKLKKVNMKETGVKNAGASNATIVLGWKYGIIVALIDIFKGTLSVLLISWLFTPDTANNPDLLYVNAACVVIGHIFPFQMKFNGGKGTATVVGIMLALDWRVALISIVLLLAVSFATNYLVIGVLVMYASFTITTLLFVQSVPAVVCTVVLWLISTLKHLENYRRIRNRSETTISSLIKKKRTA